MTTPGRIEQIRQRAAAATDGPWWAWDRGVGYEIGVGPAAADGGPDRYLPEGLRTSIGRAEDAEFIAHARQDVPHLLDLLDELCRLTVRDVHPEADVCRHDDPGSVLYIAGINAALRMVRERITGAASPTGEQP